MAEQPCKWRREPGSVMLEICRSKSGQEEVVAICNEGFSKDTGEVMVKNQQLSIYGALQAQKDSKGTIHVYVEPDITHTDSSCKLL